MSIMEEDRTLPEGYTTNLRTKVADLFHAGEDQNKMAAFYDLWAQTYDQDLVHPGFTPPRVTVREMTSLFPKNRGAVRILDCGSGTGIMGQALYNVGFTDLDALDPSQGMLDISAKKNIYKNYLCEFLDENRLPVEDNAYDVCLVIGCIVPGHVTAVCFDELMRITRSGGKIVMITRERYLQDDPELQQVEPSINRLAEAGKWNIHTRRIFSNYLAHDNGIMFILEVV